MPADGYTLKATTTQSYGEAVERVRAELANEGFGVLCEIDIQATLRAKLGVETDRYVILGACNPPLAHRALEAAPDLGALLPCNVVVYERDGETHLAAIDPERMLSLVDNDALAEVAAEVRERLGRGARSSEAWPRRTFAVNALEGSLFTGAPPVGRASSPSPAACVDNPRTEEETLRARGQAGRR